MAEEAWKKVAWKKAGKRPAGWSGQ